MAMVGCDDPTPRDTPKPPAAPAPSVTDQVKEGAREAVQKGEEIAKDIKPAVDNAVREVKTTAVEAGQAISEKVQNLTTTATTSATSTPANSEPTTELTAAELNQKIELASRYVRERKLDLADTTLKQVERQSGTLSAAGKARLGTVRQMLDTARQAEKFRVTTKQVPDLRP